MSYDLIGIDSVTGQMHIVRTGDTITASAAGTAGAVAWNDITSKPANVTALAGVTSAADKLFYFTGSGTGTVADLSSFARTLLDDTDAPTMRSTLGLGTLATQSGTFSGTSSGTNTGDQTSVSGNAGTATKLAATKNINGVAFDGSADITVAAAAGTLTGATLAAGVTASSLTSVGTLTTLTVGGLVKPSADDGAALGDTTHNFSDLFLASGSVINWANSDVTLTHSADTLTIAGGSVVFSSSATFSAGLTATGQAVTGARFIVDGTTVPAEGMYRPTGAGNLGFSVSGAAELLLTASAFSPAASDGNALGTTALQWGDLFLATGGVINWANGNATITHSTGALAFSAVPVTMPIIATGTSTSTSVTFTSAQYGTFFLWSPSGTATATLPANGATAGAWFDVILLTDQTITISAATADTLLTLNDATADSVAFSTAGSKIGACVRFISNGTKWIAINLSNHTMTIAT